MSTAKEESKTDTHSGFHGDGTSCQVFRFSDRKVEDEIKEKLASSSAR
nr:hypothetical protein [uncultured Sellimonas sp.]